MKEKFNKIKNRQKFYLQAAKKFCTTPENVKVNWFGKFFVAVPKDKKIDVEIFIDKYLEMEKDNEKHENENLIKYLNY